jgi:HK97 family phage prohead protease
MPYHVDNDNPECSGFAVVKDADGSVAGCHDTEADALDQIAALYANEAASARSASLSGGRERRHGPLGHRDRRMLPEAVIRRLSGAYGDAALNVAHRGFDIDYAGQRLEHRATKGQLELRDADDSDPVIRGYATVYGAEYDVFGGPPYGFREIVEAGATAKSIQERDEVYLFFDHEGLPLAATKAGTLTLTSDSRGLYNEARPDRASPYSMEIVSRLARGELDAMSFAFEVTDDEWSDDLMQRSIRQVKLFDVSVVSFPANPATEVGLRAAPVPTARGMSLATARAVRESLALRR